MYHDTDREERSSMIEMTKAEYGVLGEDVESEYGMEKSRKEAKAGKS